MRVLETVQLTVSVASAIYILGVVYESGEIGLGCMDRAERWGRVFVGKFICGGMSDPGRGAYRVTYVFPYINELSPGLTWQSAGTAALSSLSTACSDV